MELRKIILIAFLFSGMAALIYEITWIRPLQFLLGSTIYTTSIIFGVFMIGLAVGSLIISKYVDRIKDIFSVYGLIEIGIGFYGVLLLIIFNLLPKIYNIIYALNINFYLFELLQFILIFVVLLIPTTLMGATFPIVARIYTKEKIGKGIGEIYSVNTFGAIIGSFVAGFILIPVLGIKNSILVAAIINILIGFSIIYFVNKKLSKQIIPITLILFLTFAFVGDYNIKQMHSGGFYRTNPAISTMGEVVYYKEGLYSTVTVRELPEKGYTLFINGKGQGSYEISDLRVNFLLAYLPLLISEKNENALVIGLGTGTTSGQLSQLINVTTIEIENIKDLLTFTNGVTKYNLILNPGEKQEIGLMFNTAKEYKPGTYLGRIMISSKSVSKAITTIIEVESMIKTFDVRFNLPNKKVIAGEDLLTETTIINPEKEIGEREAQVELGIKDLEGNTIQKEELKINIETQTNLTKTIKTPKYLNVGNYVAYVLIKFNGKIGTASEVFEIIAKPAKLLSLPVSYIYMIFGLILIIIVLMIFEYLKHHYKKENKKEEVYIEIKPKIEKKFDVNKLLKESNNEDSHKFHKKTLETKLKVLKQDYELGLMGQEEYLKAKRKIEKIFKKI